MDASRPRSVSQLMYDKMKGTKFENYVVNPNKGSIHNYGIAVDVTIVDGNGKEIDTGFIPLSYEWWHFNGTPKEEARNKYPILE